LAQEKNPGVDREKMSGFVLVLGSKPIILEVGEDREVAINKAISILEEQDTIIFVSKLQSKFGETFVTKDQLVLTRKSKQGGN